MSWQQISIITDKQTAPDISDFFTELGAVSVTYMDAENQPVYEPAPGETKIWQLTKVIALFELETEPALIKVSLLSHYPNLSPEHWTQEILEDQVWERTWMEHYQPMLFGSHLWVCPTGQEVLEANTVCMTLDPGLAFGTGTHPTTALCLEWLATQALNNKTIIDYGCGSGILAIAALLLGANNVIAIDIDPQAITATLANAEKNNVLEQIQCGLPEDLPRLLNDQTQADIVLANILSHPLCDLAEHISALAKTKGQLVLSGILNEQSDTIINCYQPLGIQFNTPTSSEDWCRLDGTKNT